MGYKQGKIKKIKNKRKIKNIKKETFIKEINSDKKIIEEIKDNPELENVPPKVFSSEFKSPVLEKISRPHGQSQNLEENISSLNEQTTSLSRQINSSDISQNYQKIPNYSILDKKEKIENIREVKFQNPVQQFKEVGWNQTEQKQIEVSRVGVLDKRDITGDEENVKKYRKVKF